jgi:hypothetical protein
MDMETLTELFEAAQRAVDRLRAVPLGERFSDALDGAMTAVAVALEACHDTIFPNEIRPVSAESVKIYDLALAGPLRIDEIVGRLILLHACAVDTHPELAAFLRSPVVRWVIADQTSALAARTGKSEVEISNAEVDRFEVDCASCLIGSQAFEPAATLFVESIPALRKSLEEIRQAHLTFARQERDRIDAEQRAASEAAAHAERERRERVAAFFSSRSGQIFTIDGRALSGSAIGQIARRQAARDLDGEIVGQAVTLEQLELALRRTQASEVTL